MLPYYIAPSILSADFANLGDEITRVIEAGADWIHFDVMDNHYVPNLTIGPLVCSALKPYAQRKQPQGKKPVPIDVHLMVKPVDQLVVDFSKAGADIITFHPEASEHIDRTLQLIKNSGCQAGLVFNPATPLHFLDYVMDKLDVILLMSVNPGFGGQQFIASTLPKIVEVRRRINAWQSHSGKSIRLEVDGGIKLDNVIEVARAGADTFVAGSAIFGTPDYTATITLFRNALAQT